MEYFDNDEELTRKDIRYKPAEADVYVKCPYFPEHELRRSRLPYHIIKCQNNPLAPKLLACPHNYLHRVRPEDREQHLSECEDRTANLKFKDKKMPSYMSTMGTTSQLKAKIAAIGKPLPSSRVPPETGETDWW